MIKISKKQLISLGKKSVGFFLFIVCSVAIYREVGSNQNLATYGSQIQDQLQKISIFHWAILLLLMLLNFLIESIKWKLVLKSETTISMQTAIKSVFVGQAFAFYTPNRIGEYVGRTLMLETGNKMLAVGKMVWASYAQLIVTIMVGSLALFVNPPFLPWLKWASPLLVGLVLFIYFNQITFTGWLASFNFLQIELGTKKKLLFYSILRYMVFLLQYSWAVYILDIPIPYHVLWAAIAAMFLFLSVLPTISITELVIRGQLILFLLAPWSQNSLLLICLSTLIWVVNFLLPAIIGAFLLLSFRLKQ